MVTAAVQFRCDRCGDTVLLPFDAPFDKRRCRKCGARYQRQSNIAPKSSAVEPEPTIIITGSTLNRARAVWRCAVAVGALVGSVGLVNALVRFRFSALDWFLVLLCGAIGFLCYTLIYYFGCLALCSEMGALIVEQEVLNSPHGQHYKTRYRLTDNAEFNLYLERYVETSQLFGYVFALTLTALSFWLLSRCSSES